MPKRVAALMIVLIAGLMSSTWMHAQDEARQPGAVYDFDKKGEMPAPAPKHDLSGIWEPAQGLGAGIHANGAGEMPSDGKPEHELPYTPLGRQTFAAHKPTFGVTQVPSALTNDPMPGCNPQGFPRVVLHNFRTSRIIQTPAKDVYETLGRIEIARAVATTELRYPRDGMRTDGDRAI